MKSEMSSQKETKSKEGADVQVKALLLMVVFSWIFIWHINFKWLRCE